MKNRLTKKILLTVLSIMFMICTFAGASFASADDAVVAKSVDQVVFTMT